MAYGYRERDSQRSKLYRAESLAKIRGQEFPEVVDVEAYLTKCFSHRWFHRHYPEIRFFDVRDGRRRRAAGGRGVGATCRLWLPRWARSEGVILHELAHGVADITCDYQNNDDMAPHGWQFAEIFLDLVRHFMGAAAGERLRKSFRANRVRYYPPKKGRKMTPEQRAAACERLAAARRDKEANNS